MNDIDPEEVRRDADYVLDPACNHRYSEYVVRLALAAREYLRLREQPAPDEVCDVPGCGGPVSRRRCDEHGTIGTAAAEAKENHLLDVIAKQGEVIERLEQPAPDVQALRGQIEAEVWEARKKHEAALAAENSDVQAQIDAAVAREREEIAAMLDRAGCDLAEAVRARSGETRDDVVADHLRAFGRARAKGE